MVTEPHDGDLGPIDYLVVEFPADARPDGTAFSLLLDMVDRGLIRVMDLTFVRKELDGSVVGVSLDDFGLDGAVDITVFAGAASGLIDDADLTEAASILDPGCSGVVLIYENRWAAPFAAALRRGGAQLVGSGRIPTQALLASLDALDA
ncbi:DUF6325 family protein [Williamsia sp. R60]